MADSVVHNFQESARRDTLAKRDTTHGEENDRPEELVEVVLQLILVAVALRFVITHLLENSRREERDDRNDSDDTHVTNPFLDFMLDTPKRNSSNADETHPELLECERISRRPDRPDLDFAVAVRRTCRTVADQEQEPDEHDRNGRHRQRDSKPLRPIQRGVHFVKSN